MAVGVNCYIHVFNQDCSKQSCQPTQIHQGGSHPIHGLAKRLTSHTNPANYLYLEPPNISHFCFLDCVHSAEVLQNFNLVSHIWSRDYFT